MNFEQHSNCQQLDHTGTGISSLHNHKMFNHEKGNIPGRFVIAISSFLLSMPYIYHNFHVSTNATCIIL